MSEELDQVRELASVLAQARDEKKTCEERIKELNTSIKEIEEGTLSSLLDNIGISKVSMDDMDISKTIVFRPAYTKHSNPDAFKFLFDSNNDGALKKHLIIDLEAYPEAEMYLAGKDVEYKVEYSIHHATLGSLIKELVEAGKFSTEDIDKYGVYVQPQIKITRK